MIDKTNCLVALTVIIHIVLMFPGENSRSFDDCLFDDSRSHCRDVLSHRLKNTKTIRAAKGRINDKVIETIIVVLMIAVAQY